MFWAVRLSLAIMMPNVNISLQNPSATFIPNFSSTNLAFSLYWLFTFTPQRKFLSWSTLSRLSFKFKVHLLQPLLLIFLLSSFNGLTKSAEKLTKSRYDSWISATTIHNSEKGLAPKSFISKLLRLRMALLASTPFQLVCFLLSCHLLFWILCVEFVG
jgi:hypothetical protein